MSSRVLDFVIGAGLVLTTSIVFSSKAFAQVSVDFEAQLASELAAESGVPALMSKGIFSEVPDGLSTKEIPPHCDPRRFEDSVMDRKLTTAQYFQTAKQYFKACSGELTKNSTTGLLGLLKFTKFVYPFFTHPQVKSFMVTLPDGSKIPGILAMKQDPRPRPLVVVRCGVFCSAAQSASTKSYLMHLFDQSPFNVLILANQTGMDYIRYNRKVTLGGWAEGYESLEVGRWMQEKWEHRDRISSVHFMGISLGGNAAVMGAAFNDRYRLANGNKIFNSVTAICPVISLKPTLDNLFKGQIVGRLFYKNSKEHFQSARQYVDDVPDLLVDRYIPSSRLGMANYIGDLASTSLQRRGIASSTSSYFKSNNFWNLKERVQTPMLIWASKDDIVVSNRLNAYVMEYDDYYERSANVGVVNLSYGNHCGFSSAYGFQASAALLRTFVLKHSPEFSDSYNVRSEQPWNFGFTNLGRHMEHIGQVWEFKAGSSHAKVTFKLFNWQGPGDCYQAGPWAGLGRCTHSRSYNVPITAIQKLGARVPRNQTEAQAITREFNTKVEFVSGGKPINGTNSNQFAMRWRSHFE